MCLPFNNAIEMIAKIFEFSEIDHNAFMSDVKIIANIIHEKMIERGSMFKDMYKDLHKTAHYRKASFFDIADEFSSHLMYELPFDDIDYCFFDPYFVNIKTNRDFPLVFEGHIDAFIFAFMFHNTLKKVIAKLPPILCNGKRIYMLSLRTDNFDGISDLTRITAKEQFCVDDHPGEIIFQFLPILKFPLNTSYCLNVMEKFGLYYWTCASPFPEPLSHRNRFHHLVPFFQSMNGDDMVKARMAIILVYSLVIYGNLSKISPEMERFIYKNVYFAVLQGKCIHYMRKTDLATIFLDMLWKIKCQILRFEFPGQKEVYKELEYICYSLIDWKENNSVPLIEIFKLFELI